MDDLDTLAAGWLTLRDVAARLGCSPGEVRRLLREGHLLASRQQVDGRTVLAVPVDLLSGDEPLVDLRGTVTLLADCGFTREEALRWLLTPDDSLPGRPVEALRAGRRTEVRRRAQALAF